MLSGKDIGSLISNPAGVTLAHVPDLEELSQKYPYSQVFSLLLLKGMHASSSLDFDTTLKEHSYRIADRQQLYQLIHDFDASAAQEPVAERAVSEENAIPLISDTSNSTSDEAQAESTSENIPDETVTFDDATATDDNSTSSPEQSGFHSAENDPLEETILHHAIASHYELDALTPEEELALKERQSETKPEEEIGSEDETPETAQPNEDTIPSSERVESPLTFTDWLHADSNYIPQSDTEITITGVVEDFSDFDPMESLYGEVEKPKKEFFSPTKKARESLSEDKLPVSETLAKVYVMQGNYPKAIQAYNELILAFPEKKIFFANQIEDLKKKLNK